MFKKDISISVPWHFSGVQLINQSLLVGPKICKQNLHVPYLYKCHLALQRRGHPVRFDRMSTFCFQRPPLDGAPGKCRYVAEPVCYLSGPTKAAKPNQKINNCKKNSTWWTFLTPVHLLPCHSGALPQDNRFHSNELTPTCTVTLIQPYCHIKSLF